VLAAGGYSVAGANAEVLSVLESSHMWSTLTACGLNLELLVRCFDTRIPAEERVGFAMDAIRNLKRASRLARWIPWYSRLAEHEYAGEFYSGYRDHSIHTLQVFLLGLYLYETVRPLREHLDGALTSVAPTAKLTNFDRFWQWWILTAIWHDCGYPFEAEKFLSEETFRVRTFQRLSTEMGEFPYDEAFEQMKAKLSHEERRAIYKAGRYFPLGLRNLSELFEGYGADVVHKMWSRLGVPEGENNLCLEFDRITTQAARQRSPYHDHGLTGALFFGRLADESKSFLTELVEHQKPLPKAALASATEAWLDFEEMQELVRLAIEAIAYHNMNFASLDTRELARLMGEQSRPVASLSSNPHLVFIALADTLQDWDRHHFVINSTGNTFRPATPGAWMLVQGDGDFIRVYVKGRDGTASTVAKLFDGWVNSEDIRSLIKDKAAFSRPDRVLAHASHSVSKEEQSKRERERLFSLIGKSVRDGTNHLLQGTSESILVTSSLVTSLKRQIREAATVLTLSDEEAIDRHMLTSGLRQLEAQTAFLVKPGVKLARGVVKDKRGQGGFGTVFLLETPEKKELAFKMFHANDLDIEEKRRLFRRGFDAMETLGGHPGVVRVHAFSELPVGFYMDFIHGSDLSTGLHLLDSLQDRILVALEISRTLAHAHARRVLHRDVKPGNVLLDASHPLEPVLTDFDLAWIDGRTMNTKQAFASYQYGAPEQFTERMLAWRKKPTVDIYSMGALLFYLLTNQAPPGHGNWTDDWWREFQQRLEGQLPAICVSELLSLVQVATRERPEERFQSMEDIVSRLSRVHMLSSRQDGLIPKQDWTRELLYRASGNVNSGMSFTSRAGGVTWWIDSVSERGETVDLKLSFMLNYEPRHEGVNYEGYQKGVMRNIDARLLAFEHDWSLPRLRRHGQLGTSGAKVELELFSIPKTVQLAGAVAELTSAVSRIVE
jgi:serine/threonine protein kinase